MLYKFYTESVKIDSPNLDKTTLYLKKLSEMLDGYLSEKIDLLKQLMSDLTTYLVSNVLLNTLIDIVKDYDSITTNELRKLLIIDDSDYFVYSNKNSKFVIESIIESVIKIKNLIKTTVVDSKKLQIAVNKLSKILLEDKKIDSIKSGNKTSNNILDKSNTFHYSIYKKELYSDNSRNTITIRERG